MTLWRGWAEGRASVRRALLLWLLLPLVVLVPLAATSMYQLSVRPALESLDRTLKSTAAALADMLEVRGSDVVLPLGEQADKALRTDLFDAVYFAVTDPQGHLLAGDAELARQQPTLAADEWRFFDATMRGQTVRVVAWGARCGNKSAARICPILVAESLGKRTAAKHAILTGAGLTLLPLAIALVALGAIAVVRGLRPLRRLSAEIEHRSLENLQPVDAAGVPEEVAPIVGALNRLLERLRVASLAQQAFLADAAHQLRTPLAALRTESELALLEEHPEQLDATLRRIHVGAARAARLANQLLLLARADHDAQTTAAAPVDLQTLCTEAAQDWLRPCIDANVDLGFELEPAWVMGRGHLLRELLANLLHNAIEHAGRGAHVTVRTAVRGEHATLEVEDDGPGIAEAERENVWGRFQRGDKTRGSGSGLGLAIVRDIAHSHGATAQLGPGNEGRGLRVRISFPALPSAAKSA